MYGGVPVLGGIHNFDVIDSIILIHMDNDHNNHLLAIDNP